MHALHQLYNFDLHRFLHQTIDKMHYEIQNMSKLQDRYDKLAEKLEELQEQKRRIEADAIMEAYLKSGKNFDEIMTFLSP